MKYIKQTLDYLFVKGMGKRFLSLFLFMLFPSALITYGLRLDRVVGNIVSCGESLSWGDIWLSYFIMPASFIVLPIGFFVIVLAFALLSDIIIKHFRTGVFGIKQIGKSFNDYFVPSLIYISFCTATYLLFYTLYTLISYACYANFEPIVYSVLSGITWFLLVFAILYIFSALTLWLPMMCITGFLKPSSLLSATYKSKSKQKHFYPGHVFCMFILLLTAIISYFVSSIWYISWILNAIGFSLSYTFFVIFTYTVYFGENLLPREDINQVRRYRR